MPAPGAQHGGEEKPRGDRHRHAGEAIGFLLDRLPLEPTSVDINEVFGQASLYEVHFAELRGQDSAKRTLTICRCGSTSRTDIRCKSQACVYALYTLTPP